MPAMPDRIQEETVWLTQDQMAQLFGKAKSTINEHVKNIFKEGELVEKQVMRKFGNSEFSTKPTHYYNLDVIISVGYRVKSLRGTQFRIWATQRLREYIIKGFALDDERLKEAGGGNYFDELLSRIRDIRASEKVFWRKVLDIYALSIDYDPHTDYSREFFAVVQNKMHWAAHGHTAAEIINQRADAAQSNMGLTTWSGAKPRKADVEVAKNYLSEKELDVLNRIVTMYLEFAELQALNRKTAALAQSLHDKLEAQKIIKALEKKRNNKRRELFDAQDAIDSQREELIVNIEKQLKQRHSMQTLFVIRGEVR